MATYDPDDGFRGSDHMRLRVSDGSLQSNAFDVDLVITRNHAPQCFTNTTHIRVGTAVVLPTTNVCFDQDFQDSGDLTIALDPSAPPRPTARSRRRAATSPTRRRRATRAPTASASRRPTASSRRSRPCSWTSRTRRLLPGANPARAARRPEERHRQLHRARLRCRPDLDYLTAGEGDRHELLRQRRARYTANQGASGADSFRFKAGEGELSPVATQNVVIDPAANEARIAAIRSRRPHIRRATSSSSRSASTPTATRSLHFFPFAPSHGTTRKEFGSIVYTAAAGYTGGDDLEITVTDGHGASVPIEQIIDVRPPQAPGCAPVQAISARPGDVRTVTVFCTNPQGDAQTYATAQQGQKGTVTAGDFPGQFRYTANAGASGADQFTLRASNVVGNTDVPVDVTVDEAWNTAPHCVQGSATVAKGTTTDLPLASRCADDEGDAITFTRASQPAQGSVTAGPAATLQLTTDPDFTGFDSFTYTATDSRGLASSPQFFSLNVVASLEPTCTPQVAISVRPGASRSVSMSCQEPANAPLTYEIVSGPAKGTLSPAGNSTTPFRTYTANAGASGADPFSYRARSSNGTSATLTQSITIDPNANTAPTCTANGGFPIQVPAGRPTARVIPFCSDAEFDALTYQHVTQPQHGTVTTANGVMTYTPAAGYTGPDQFTYTVGDGRAITGPNTVNLQVVPVTPPTCEEPDPIEVRPSSPARPVPVDCTDALSEPFEIVIDDEPDHGTITMFADRPLYDADSGYTGPDSFSYHAENANGSSEIVAPRRSPSIRTPTRRRSASPAPSRSGRAPHASSRRRASTPTATRCRSRSRPSPPTGRSARRAAPG